MLNITCSRPKKNMINMTPVKKVQNKEVNAQNEEVND